MPIKVYIQSENDVHVNSLEKRFPAFDMDVTTCFNLADVMLVYAGSATKVLRTVFFIRCTGDNIPIIVLGGSFHEKDIIKLYLAGMDCYWRLPMKTEEMYYRIKAMTKYARMRDFEAPILTYGDVVLETLTLKKANGTAKVLTPFRYRILRFFMLNPDQLVTRKELFEAVYGDGSLCKSRTLEMLIARLRKDLKGTSIAIMTIHNKGYILREIDTGYKRVCPTEVKCQSPVRIAV